MPDPYGRSSGGFHVKPRCWRCNRMLAIVLSPPYAIRCPRCKAMNLAGEIPGSAIEESGPDVTRSTTP